jgi:hypothetical protein
MWHIGTLKLVRSALANVQPSGYLYTVVVAGRRGTGSQKAIYICEGKRGKRKERPARLKTLTTL